MWVWGEGLGEGSAHGSTTVVGGDEVEEYISFKTDSCATHKPPICTDSGAVDTMGSSVTRKQRGKGERGWVGEQKHLLGSRSRTGLVHFISDLRNYTGKKNKPEHKCNAKSDQKTPYAHR